MKLRMTEGPAVSRATPPANTYTPTPRVEPTPSSVRSVVLSTRARELEDEATTSSCFLRVNRDIREVNILRPARNVSLKRLMFLHFDI